MPTPEPPKDDEDRQTFISRCVSHEGFKRAHPDRNERLGRCFTMWERRNDNN